MTMLKFRDRTWVAADRPGHRPADRGGAGTVRLHRLHLDAPASERAGGAIGDAFGLVAEVGRRGRAGAADRPRQRDRAEPAGTVGGGRCRRRHRVGRRLRLGGHREARARRARHAVQDRHRLHGAHVGRGRPAAGEGPSEARRRDSGVRPGVPEEAVARDPAAGDGACRRRPERRRRRRAAVRGALRAAGRRPAALRGGVAAVRAGDRVPLLALRLDPGERGGRSRRGRSRSSGSCGSRSSSRWA